MAVVVRVFAGVTGDADVREVFTALADRLKTIMYREERRDNQQPVLGEQKHLEAGKSVNSLEKRTYIYIYMLFSTTGFG